MTEIIYDSSSLSAAYGGAEVFYSYRNISGLVIKLVSNIGAMQQYLDPNADKFFTIDTTFTTFELNGETHARVQVLLNNVVVDESDYPLDCPNLEIINNRIVFDKAAISVYTNDKWVYTYAFVSSIWPETTEIKLKVSGADVPINIVYVELADPREAVYIDYEATTDSAIQSIIQQRPIQIYAEAGRANTFTYFVEREQIPAHHIFSYEEQTQDNNQLSSDGLVYYRDVGVSNSPLTAEQVGLITRLYRLSELDNGAVQATRRIQQLALEQRKIIKVSARFDLRVEIADRYLIDTFVTCTNRHVTDEIIIQEIQTNLQDGSYVMNITGRRKLL